MGDPASSTSQATNVVTFSRDVAPILYRHCVECHRPNNIGPMPLLTYENVQPYAQLIAEKVESREMPPWHADPHFGTFSNERRLNSNELSKIIAWVKQGAIEGNKSDLPAAPSFSNKWEIGQPDYVFKMAGAHTLGRGIGDMYVYFRIPTNFSEDKWVQSVEFRPGNRKIVHHAVAFIETPEQFAAIDSGPGSSERTVKSTWSLLDSKPTALELMEGTTRRIRPDVGVVNDGCATPDFEAVGAGSNNLILSVYAPGRGVDVWPEGTAKKIPAGSNIILQMHYAKNENEIANDLTSVGLILAKAPVRKVVNTRSINNVLFEIPPGANNHQVTACWNVQREVELINFMPHMHVRGKSMRYEIVYPNAQRQTLLFVPHYSFHWQLLYTLKQPLIVPANSKLMVTAYFDNSARNMHNPDPAKAVRHGSATTDEMMIGFVDYVVPKPRDHIIAEVDSSIYNSYVGQYEFNSNIAQSIVKDGDRLYTESGGQRVELHPSSETTFFISKEDAEISFIKNAAGTVTGFTITQNDKLLKFNKISSTP